MIRTVEEIDGDILHHEAEIARLRTLRGLAKAIPTRDINETINSETMAVNIGALVSRVSRQPPKVAILRAMGGFTHYVAVYVQAFSEKEARDIARAVGGGV